MTFCDCSLPGSSAHGILQERILPWVAIFFSRTSSWPRDQTCAPGLQANSLSSELQGNTERKYFWRLFWDFMVSSVAQQCLTLFDLGLQHVRLPCPTPTLRVCSNSCPSGWWCHPTISSVIPFSYFNLSQHQGLFQWVSSLYQVAKVLKLHLQLQSFQWIFRTDFL